MNHSLVSYSPNGGKNVMTKVKQQIGSTSTLRSVQNVVHPLRKMVDATTSPVGISHVRLNSAGCVLVPGPSTDPAGTNVTDLTRMTQKKLATPNRNQELL